MLHYIGNAFDWEKQRCIQKHLCPPLVRTAEYIELAATAWSKNDSYNSFALYTGNYDAVGIEFYPNYATDTDVFSPMQAFPIPARGQSRKYGLFCMDVNNSPMGEAQVRMVSITNNGSNIRIYSETPGYYYNWGNKGQSNTCAVPAFLYGMKF